MTGRVSIVTGAASGIGEALSRALLRRGGVVVMTDRDGAALETARSRLGAAEGMGRARTAILDVTDDGAFAEQVQQTVAREGRLDCLFNNAGVGLAGEVRDLDLAAWRRVIDVNLWGVVNGISSAYPQMVAQGFGHIVNTASGAGLAPRPGMAAYAAVKHAVVGLSTSLRAEAAAHGVKVSVVCPGYVKTNIVASTEFVNVDGAGLMDKVPLRPMSADQCARVALAGVDANRAIIPVSGYVWLDWLLYRASPALSMTVSRWRARQFRAFRSP